MDGWDMKKGEVCKKNGIYKEREREREREREKKREEHWEKKEWTVTFLM